MQNSDRKKTLSPYSIGVLRAVDVAGSRDWASANAIAEVVLGLGRRGSQRPGWLREAASRGKVYGDLKSSRVVGLLDSRIDDVRGKPTQMYKLKDRGRKVLLQQLVLLQEDIQLAIKNTPLVHAGAD